MTKLKVRRLKWKNVKVRGSVLHFCLYFISISKSKKKCYIWLSLSFYLYLFLLHHCSTSIDRLPTEERREKKKKNHGTLTLEVFAHMLPYKQLKVLETYFQSHIIIGGIHKVKREISTKYTSMVTLISKPRLDYATSLLEE